MYYVNSHLVHICLCLSVAPSLLMFTVPYCLLLFLY